MHDAASPIANWRQREGLNRRVMDVMKVMDVRRRRSDEVTR
jgi:hypothetical protein